MAYRRKTETSTKHKNLRTNSPLTQPVTHIKGKLSQRIEKIEKPCRRSPRLCERLLRTLSSLSLDPPQEPQNKYEDHAGTHQWTQGRVTDVSILSDECQPLTSENLEIHTMNEGYLDKLELLRASLNLFSSGGSEWQATAIGNDNASTEMEF